MYASDYSLLQRGSLLTSQHLYSYVTMAAFAQAGSGWLSFGSGLLPSLLGLCRAREKQCNNPINVDLNP
jgi:hypothetical protein